MKLNTTHIQKLDPLLRKALERATGEEFLSTLMLLRPESKESANDAPESTEPDPSHFESREEYRGALIARQREMVSRGIEGTLQALADLSLRPRGGSISHAVVVQGAARQILSALELPGVAHATLDRPVTLVEPQRPRKNPVDKHQTPDSEAQQPQ